MKKRSLWLLLLLFAASGTRAQHTNLSPYSRYGLGEIQSPGFSHHMGMGGLTTAMADLRLLNIENPATYSMLHVPSFNIGANSQSLILDDGTHTNTTTTVNFRHFAAGLPLGKRGGMSFGIVPYSTVGYDIATKEENADLGEVNYTYFGKGGLGKTYLGGAFSIINRDSARLSFGANAAFLFGSVDQTRRIIFASGSGAFNTRVQNALIVRGLTYDMGVFYSGYLNKNWRFSAGATSNLPVELNAKQNVLAVSYHNNSAVIDLVKDTLERIDSVNGSVDMPQKISYGLLLEWKKQWTIGMQYETQIWSHYQERFEDTTTNLLQNSQAFRVGLRYKPEPNLSPDSKIWNRCEYRLGARYATNYVHVGSHALDEYGLSMGIGIPMARLSSMVNFGIEFGERGNVAENGLREQFLNIQIDFALSPIGKWFRKPKYD